MLYYSCSLLKPNFGYGKVLLVQIGNSVKPNFAILNQNTCIVIDIINICYDDIYQILIAQHWNLWLFTLFKDIMLEYVCAIFVS